MRRFGYSIFCDDIRNEVGGKLSFIGCYSSVLFVTQKFPFVLPKFCVHSYVVTTAEDPFRSVSIRCYVPGHEGPILDEKIETPQLPVQRLMASELEASVSAPRQIVASASLVLSPFELSGSGLIRIRAVVDGATDELSLGALRVVAQQ